MALTMIGVDHSTAAVDVRSVFSFTTKAIAEAQETMKHVPGIRGSVILSTCNRVELWLSVGEEFQRELFPFLCELKNTDPQGKENAYCIRSEREAVDHLFELTCGLKSQILAEDQILTQVKNALTLARENNAADNCLEILFRMAVTAAKKAKTEVAFSHGNETAISQAVANLKAEGYTFADKTVMVIGNGEMGKIAAQTLSAEGADVTVTVRQYRSGVVEIPRGCNRINYGDRYEHMQKCDLVVSATASPNCTVTKEAVEALPKDRARIFIDLAVPRDIEPEIKTVPGVSLYDIDDFKISHMSETMLGEVAQAEKILAEQKEEFYSWYYGQELIPRIQALRPAVTNDVTVRIEKIVKKTVSDEETTKKVLSAVENAEGKVYQKLMFGLKDELDRENFERVLTAMEKIYGR